MRSRRGGGTIAAARVVDTTPPPPPPVGDFVDDFDGASGAPPNPTDWDTITTTAGSTVRLNGAGQLEMTGGTNGNAFDRQYIRLNKIYADFDMTVVFRYPSTSAGHNPRIGWRGAGIPEGTGKGDRNGYCVYFSDLYDYWNVEEWNSGITTEYMPDSYHPNIPFSSNSLVNVRVQMVGSQMAIKVWLDAATEPVDWQYTRSDSTHTSGFMWLSHTGGADTTPDVVRWESISITGTVLDTAPPPPPPPPPPTPVAPTDITLSGNTVEENQTAPRAIGSFTAVEPTNPTDTHTYSLVTGAGDTNNNLFTIVGSQLRLAANVGAVGTRTLRVRATDQGGLFFEKAFTINVIVAGAWLTTAGAILNAFNTDAPEIRIGHGTYDFGAGQALKLRVPNQRVVAQPGGTVTLRVTVRQLAYGGFGVIDVTPTANFAEISGEGSTFILTQTVSQTLQTLNNNDRQVVGIDCRANDWYIHDVIADKTSFGYAIWVGNGTGGGLRRLHRVITTNNGYWGTGEAGGEEHSGNAIYHQTPNVPDPALMVDVDDFVMHIGTRIGWHMYGSFGMPAPITINGVDIVDTGSPLPTGQFVAGGSPMYMAKSEHLEVHHGHFMVRRTDWQSPNFAMALNRVGYGSSFVGQHFVASDGWFVDATGPYPNPTSRWTKQGTWATGHTFDYGTATQREWALLSQRAAFWQTNEHGLGVGIHPLGSTWSVFYGEPGQPLVIPAGWVQVPGTILFESIHGMPSHAVIKPA